MRTGAAADHTGYFHETSFVGSDDELLDVVVPFLVGGAEAGEPTLVSLDDRSAAVLHGAVSDVAGVTFLPHASQYANPATTIKQYRDVVESHVAAGAGQVRAVGSVPHPGLGAPWDGWARYEAAIHRALADLPLWGICPYDTRITPADVLADAELLHPHIARTDGRHATNVRFAPEAVVARRSPPEPDPLEAWPPDLVQVEPTPAAARHGVQDVSRRSGVDHAAVDDLLVAVSEVVTNALTHGRPPVVLRAWAAADRVVVAVNDQGTGPADPLVGLMPAPDRSPGGLGLWIAHQLCGDISLATDADGFTVRLIARR